MDTFISELIARTFGMIVAAAVIGLLSKLAYILLKPWPNLRRILFTPVGRLWKRRKVGDAADNGRHAL